MSLIKKMKDILFDEEEIIEESVVPKKTVETVSVKEREIPVIEKIKVPQPEKKLEDTKEMKSPFIDFDEDEFVNSIPRVPSEPVRSESRVKVEPSRGVQKPKYSEFERKTTIEKRSEYGRYEKTEKVEFKEKRKFQPSLIISPVYGVLNEDYNPDDIKTISEEIDSPLSIDEVRKKAYGDLEKLEQTIDEPVETFFEEKVKVSVKPLYETEEKVKTIDELLNISADEKIDVEENLYVEEEFSLTEEISLPKAPEKRSKKIDVFEEEEDTLENDLFDLIDSMYESKEEVF